MSPCGGVHTSNMKMAVYFILFMLFPINGIMSTPNCHQHSLDTFEYHQEESTERGLAIVPNAGQIGSQEVLFHTDNILFKRNGLIIRIDEKPANKKENAFSIGPTHLEPEKLRSSIFTLTFLGTDGVVPIESGIMAHRNNFFFGNISSQWITDVPSYESLTYFNLYTGIDLSYRITDSGIKSEYEVHPGANFRDIRIEYKGASCTIENGDIFFNTTAGYFVDGNLLCYQETEEGQRVVETEIINENNILSYEIETSDLNPSASLIIDPLFHSTFLGGSGDENGIDITVDTMDNIYLCGSTSSIDFPTTPGTYNTTNNDIFISKLDSIGNNLLFSTYFGGQARDSVQSIVLDSNDDIYASGSTASMDFPTTQNGSDTTYNGYADIFLIKLSNNGSKLLYSTFIGGRGDDDCRDMTIDSSNVIYLTGETLSDDFPYTPNAFCTTHEGAHDIFLVQFSPFESKLMYSSYYGGTNTEYANSIEIDESRNIYIGGKTDSSDFPTTDGAFSRSLNGLEDAFFLKFSPDFSDLIIASYFGGERFESGFVAPGEDNSIYIVGTTSSGVFPITQNAYQKSIKGSGTSDIFISKLDNQGTILNYSSYIGGNQSDLYYSNMVSNIFNVCPDGSVIVSTITASDDFPVTDDARDKEYNGYRDIAILRMGVDGSGLLYSTYLGGNDLDIPFSLYSNYMNVIYLVGSTFSGDFPVSVDCFDNGLGGRSDAFLLKMHLSPWVPSNISAQTGYEYVLLNWNPPDDVAGVSVDNYTIFRGPDPTNLQQIDRIGNQTWYNDTTAINGNTYYYSISAENKFDIGDISRPIRVDAGTVPFQPLNMTAVPGDQFIELKWDPPADDGGYHVVNYAIQRGNDASDLARVSLQGNITFYNDLDVVNGREYFYSVSAINLKGEGPRSDTINVTPGRIPSPPQNLKAVPDGVFIHLAWFPPIDDGDCLILGYSMYRADGTADKKVVAWVDSPAVEYLDGPFDGGSILTYHLTALNAVGESDRSNEAIVNPNNRPAPPLNLYAIVEPPSITLGWEQPADDGGSPLTGYNIYEKSPIGQDD